MLESAHIRVTKSAVRAFLVRHTPTVVAAALAVIIPKCPLCLAVWAGALGLGVVSRTFLAGPWSVPFLIALLFLPSTVIALRGSTRGFTRTCTRNSIVCGRRNPDDTLYPEA